MSVANKLAISPSEIATLKEVKVLYAEDDNEIRKQTSDILKTFFDSVIEACDGKQALEYYMQNQSRIDLLITDINMPIMSGIEWIGEVRKIDKNIPALITSAYGDEAHYQDAINVSINKYFRKPLKIIELLAGAYVAIEKHKKDKLNIKAAKDFAKKAIELKKDLAVQTEVLGQVVWKNKSHSWFIENCIIGCDVDEKGRITETTKLFDEVFELSKNDMSTDITSGSEIGAGVQKLILQAFHEKKEQKQNMLLFGRGGDFKAEVVITPVISRISKLVEGYKIVVMPEICYSDYGTIV